MKGIVYLANVLLMGVGSPVDLPWRTHSGVEEGFDTLEKIVIPLLLQHWKKQSIRNVIIIISNKEEKNKEDNDLGEMSQLHDLNVWERHYGEA